MGSIAIRRLHTLSRPLLAASALVASAWLAMQLAEVRASDAADRAPHPIAPAPAPAPPPPPPRVDDTARGVALVARNMFCATCLDTGPGAPPPPGAPRFTGRLIATHVETATLGFATITDATRGTGGSYATGAALGGGATLVAVRRGAIDVRHPDESIETITLDAAGAPPPPPPPQPSAPASAWGDRVRALGDDRFEVDRRLIGELVGGGTTAAVPGVRLAPITKDGDLAGIKVVSARAGSLARTLGLEPGDVIEAIDGQPITSARMLMELYGQVDRLPRVALGIRRKDAARTLAYELR